MSNNPYSSPDTDLSEGENEFILKRWFNGDIKLWKAIVFIQILGWLVVIVISTLSVVVLPGILFIIFNILLLPSYAIYSSICVYRASPNPKVSIKGAIAKLWSIVFIIYGLFITQYVIAPYLEG